MGKKETETEKLTAQLMVRLNAEQEKELLDLAEATGNTPAAMARLAVKALIDHYVENGRTITFPLRLRFEAKERLQLAAEDAGKYPVRKPPPRRPGNEGEQAG